MNVWSHMLIGATAGVMVARAAGVEELNTLGLCAAAGLFGGPLADWDQRWAQGDPPPGSDAQLLEHRGPTHSLLAAIVLGWAVSHWLSVLPAHDLIGFALSAGYLTHLLCDELSPMGVPFFYPFWRKRLRLVPWRLRVKSGTLVLELPLATAIFWLGVQWHP